MYILTIAWLVVAVVGCGGSASPTGAAVGCEDGTLKPCTCDDGSKSTASCASGVYGACDCQPADGSSRAGDSSGADAVQPDTAQPDTAQPDTAQPDVLPADIAQPDTAQPDTAQPDTVSPDTADTSKPQCQKDADCGDPSKVCDLASKTCVTVAPPCVVLQPVGKRTGQPTVGSVAIAFTAADCQGEPLVGLAAKDFAILEDSKPVSATESGATILSRKATVYVTLVLDNSPSVKAQGGLDAAVKAAKAFAAKLMGDDPLAVRVAVAVFSLKFKVVQAHTSDAALVQKAIDGLLTDTTGINTTNLYGALIDAVAYNSNAQSTLNSDMLGGVLTQGHVVLFTDGTDQASVKTLDDAKAALAATTDQVRTVGFGTEVDPAVLQTLGPAGSLVGKDASALDGLFGQVAVQIQKQRQALYVLGYCSPKLAGTHQVEIEIAGKGKAPPVQFSADGWLAALDAGAPGCNPMKFETACQKSECGGLWCGGCVQTCDDSTDPVSGETTFACGCKDPKFSGATCAVCSDPKKTGADCATCKDPLYTGADCTTCADPSRTGPGCTACKDPAKTGPKCDQPAPCPSAPDGTPCSDGNACTQGDACKGGTCQFAKQIACDDGNPCTADACNPTTGACEATPQAGPCSDGNNCTVGDSCDAGACKAGANQCGCKTTADCAWKEDGNACNGTLKCDTTLAVPTCVLDATTVVSCPGSVCQAATCDPSNGACGKSPLNGPPCDADGSVCSQDACASGACKAGPATWCDDGVKCTIDACDAKTGCSHTPSNAGCDDGNVCTEDLCDATAGCSTKPVSGGCEDGNVCTLNDTCKNSACTAGTPKLCQDGNPCTADTCDASKGCLFPACETAGGCGSGCDDDNACTTADACANSVCAGKPTVVCDDKDPCTADFCDPKLGCQSKPGPVAPCTDDNLCTVGDACIEGKCTAGAPKACDSGSQCVVGKCSLVGTDAGKCKYDYKDGMPCEDGNACTLSDTCASDVCGGLPNKCDDNNSCTTDSCDKLLGCKHSPNTDACDDGDACTSGDKCTSGTCNGTAIDPSKPKDIGGCNDGNPCTDDGCNPVMGCTNKPNTGNTCDDGNPCTSGDICKMGTCKSGINVCAGTCGSNPSKTCKGQCGSSGIGGCWCDALCQTNGNCCPDIAACGCP